MRLFIPMARTFTFNLKKYFWSLKYCTRFIYIYHLFSITSESWFTPIPWLFFLRNAQVAQLPKNQRNFFLFNKECYSKDVRSKLTLLVPVRLIYHTGRCEACVTDLVFKQQHNHLANRSKTTVLPQEPLTPRGLWSLETKLVLGLCDGLW